MSEIERLNFSKPPPAYVVKPGEFDQEQFPVVRMWHATSELHSSSNHASEDQAIVAAWAHHKTHHDPPGMRVESCKGAASSPQSGWFVVVLLHGDVSRWLFVKLTKAEARAAAWAWYEGALEVTDLLDGENGPTETWPELCAWPRPLRWTIEQRNEVRRLCLEGGDWSEVLRVL